MKGGALFRLEEMKRISCSNSAVGVVFFCLLVRVMAEGVVLCPYLSKVEHRSAGPPQIAGILSRTLVLGSFEISVDTGT